MIADFTIDYEEARQAVDTIAGEVIRRRKAAVIAVVDSHGELIAFAKMDGAPLPSIRIAINKAYTAARAQKVTKEIGDKVRHPEQGFDIAYYGDPGFVGWGGGVPVWKNGKVAGAVAVSGLPQAEDMELATLAAAAISG
ncbi:MAG: heme-binding protein [Acidobacteriota bacterium]|nr:heme-binding protein [Acidobacteriota bacterium]